VAFVEPFLYYHDAVLRQFFAPANGIRFGFSRGEWQWGAAQAT